MPDTGEYHHRSGLKTVKSSCQKKAIVSRSGRQHGVDYDVILGSYRCFACHQWLQNEDGYHWSLFKLMCLLKRVLLNRSENQLKEVKAGADL